MAHEEIRAALVEMLRDILRDPAAEFDPQRSLVDDYALDSLDLLDLAYHIEERYGVKIGARELSGRSQAGVPEEELLDDDGLLTDRALEEMRRSIPEIPAERIRRGLRRGDIPRLLNLAVFARLVAEKVAAREAGPGRERA